MEFPPLPNTLYYKLFYSTYKKKTSLPFNEIIRRNNFLKHFFKGKYCVENVKSYYDPLIPPQHIGRHYLWANFRIPKIKMPKIDIGKMNGKNQTASKKPLTERNAVNSNLGLHILDCALEIIKHKKRKQTELF